MSGGTQASAILDLRRVHTLADCFPSHPWQTISTRIFVADSGARIL
jgi:hypothetical protein